jgi:type III restriction enzyme
MGLRAFTSQLLCEQVIGRGLRRVARLRRVRAAVLPEYVNIFGVPLSIFQDMGGGGEATPPPPKHECAYRGGARAQPAWKSAGRTY